MMLYPAFHDDGPKTIVGGLRIPAHLLNERFADRFEVAELFRHTGP